MFVPLELLRDQVTPSGRPQRRFDAVTLVRSHGLRRPAHLPTGFGAGAMFGMRYFCDDEPLEFLVPRGTRSPGIGHLRYRSTRGLDEYRASAVHPDPQVPGLAVAAPGTAFGHMLRALQDDSPDREMRWRVPDLTAVHPTLDQGFIRSVQVSDAFHQALGAAVTGDPGQLTGVTLDRAAAVLGATDVGAESPPETLMRLVLADLSPGMRTQIPVWEDDGSLLTVVDMGWEEQRLFLFYDGAHHLQRTQRDHDSRVLTVLQRDRGRVHRVTAGQLATVDAVMELREAVRQGLAS